MTIIIYVIYRAVYNHTRGMDNNHAPNRYLPRCEGTRFLKVGFISQTWIEEEETLLHSTSFSFFLPFSLPPPLSVSFRFSPLSHHFPLPFSLPLRSRLLKIQLIKSSLRRVSGVARAEIKFGAF